MVNKTKKNQPKQPLIFDRQNYILVIVGVLLMGIGFILMIGGGSNDPNTFNPEELYSFRRIPLAPVLVISGLVVEMIAIMKKPKDDSERDQ